MFCRKTQPSGQRPSQAQQPTRESRPVELDPKQLALVAGGSPKGTWLSPKGTW